MPEIEDPVFKIERAQKRYWSSEAGKATNRRYNLSEKGKDARKKYLESENGKKALLRYYLSEKAETTRQKRQALLKLFRQLDNFLRAHPEKTFQDALEQLTKKRRNDRMNPDGKEEIKEIKND